MRKLNYLNITVALLVLLFWFLVISSVTSCTSKKVNNPESNVTAIMFEGLFSDNIGFLRSALKEDMENEGIRVYAEAWTSDINISADFCLGHSFGGGTLMRKAKSCKVTITFDARELNYKNNDSYETRAALGKHYNFYEEQDALRGYPINGAINIKIKSSHVGLPNAARDQAMAIIKEAM